MSKCRAKRGKKSHFYQIFFSKISKISTKIWKIVKISDSGSDLKIYCSDSDCFQNFGFVFGLAYFPTSTFALVKRNRTKKPEKLLTKLCTLSRNNYLQKSVELEVWAGIWYIPFEIAHCCSVVFSKTIFLLFSKTIKINWNRPFVDIISIDFCSSIVR